MNGAAPILFLSGIRWDFARQRHQRLAALLARRRPVLFLEMGFSPAHLLRQRRETAAHWRSSRRGLQKEGENLWISVGPPLLPGARRFLALQRLNRSLLYRRVRRKLRRLGLQKPLIWISDPYFGAPPAGWEREGVIFDWIHLPVAEPPSRRTVVYRALLEEVCASADLVFTPSRLVLERRGARDPRFHYLPHGVDPAFFGAGPEAPAPSPLAALPRPVVGFAGTMGQSFDGELVAALARSRPDWSFVLVGEARSALLPRGPNILSAGPCPPRDLPRWLEAFSAGIIPYRVDPATETVHPVKTYEYLAAGLPVVSTPLPEIAHLAGLVAFAANPEDFARRLEEEMQGDTPAKRAARRGFARENTWEKRAEEIERIIAAVLTPAAKK